MASTSTGPVILGTPTPIIDANIEHKTILTPDGFAAVLVPADGDKHDGYVILRLVDEKVKPWASVVASACEGKTQSTHLGGATVQVLNVVPQHGELFILIEIRGGPVDYRAHVFIYY